MKTISMIGLIVTFGLLVANGSGAAEKAAMPDFKKIAAEPEMIVSAIRHQTVEASAAMVGQTLAVIFSSDWPEEKKRGQCTALITFAVAAKGKEAAPMMHIVTSLLPPARVPLVAATAVIAAGDYSPAVAKAMLAALSTDAQTAEACRSACANPSTVLLPTEIGIIRGITLPTPTQAPAKAPPLPTIIRAAEKYPGQ